MSWVKSKEKENEERKGEKSLTAREVGGQNI